MKRNLIVSLLFACALNYTAAIALFGLAVAQAQGSGGPCSGTPCEIPNLFDPDLADLKPANNAALSDFIKGALDRTKSGNKETDRDCYPKPITVAIFTKPTPEDPKVQNLILDGRMDALMNYFHDHHLDPQNIEQVKSLGEDKVEGTYNDTDRDPPVLKTNSTPPKGTKVKALRV